MPAGIDLAVITPADAKAYAVFEVTSAEAILYEKVSTASIQYTPNERNAASVSEKSEVEKKVYSEETDLYTYYAPLENADKISEGQMVNVYLSDTSPLYNTVVPLSAVHEDMGEIYVYYVYEADGLFGKENRVKKSTVTKQDENDFNMAVEGDVGAGQVVVSTTRPLSDGQRVRVME